MIEERFGRKASTSLLALITATVFLFCLWWIWFNIVTPAYDHGQRNGWWDSLPTQLSVFARLLAVLIIGSAAGYVIWLALLKSEAVRRRVFHSFMKRPADSSKECLKTHICYCVQSEDERLEHTRRKPPPI